jgi:energy-coupling factor transporter ATP-binding protein EcfA2
VFFMENNRLKRVEWVDLNLPSLKDFDRFLGWMVGRVCFSGWLFTISTIRVAAKIIVSVCDQTERASRQILAVYEQLPHKGMLGANVLDTTAIALPLSVENIITNLLQAIEGKHVLIIGDTGTGKSTIAQWLAYQVGGDITVYDSDASPDEWAGLNVVGRKGNFQAIADAMEDDLQELQRRIELRGESGDRALAGMDSVTIAEEFPLLVSEVDVASAWLIKHGNRGRKPKRFIVALSQDDSVAALGIEGQGNARKNFRFVRLGKFGVAHAKKLKDAAVEEWLKAGKYRCMVEDTPCQLPDLSSFNMFMPRVSIQPSLVDVKTAETTAEPELQPISSPENQVSDALLKAVKACMQAGFSDSKVIKEVLGFSGGRYQEGKQILEKMKGEMEK